MPEAQFVRNDVRLGGDLRLLIISGRTCLGRARCCDRSTKRCAGMAERQCAQLTQHIATHGWCVNSRDDSLQDGRSRFYARLLVCVNCRLAECSRTVLF